MKKVKVTKENLKNIKKATTKKVKEITRIKKSKKDFDIKKEIKRIQELRLSIIKYLEGKSDKYYIFLTSPYSLIVGKSQILTVHSINENSVFQPVEKKETKKFLTLLMIHFCDGIYTLENELVDLGCELIHIRSESEIESKLG